MACRRLTENQREMREIEIPGSNVNRNVETAQFSFKNEKKTMQYFYTLAQTGWNGNHPGRSYERHDRGQPPAPDHALCGADAVCEHFSAALQPRGHADRGPVSGRRCACRGGRHGDADLPPAELCAWDGKRRRPYPLPVLREEGQGADAGDDPCHGLDDGHSVPYPLCPRICFCKAAPSSPACPGGRSCLLHALQRNGGNPSKRRRLEDTALRPHRLLIHEHCSGPAACRCVSHGSGRRRSGDCGIPVCCSGRRPGSTEEALSPQEITLCG